MKMNTTQVTIIRVTLCAGRADALIDSDMGRNECTLEKGSTAFRPRMTASATPIRLRTWMPIKMGGRTRDESMAGTDPYDAGSAERFGMQVVHNQTTASCTHRSAVRGKYYELFVSDDLETWTSKGLLKHNAQSGTTDLPKQRPIPRKSRTASGSLRCAITMKMEMACPIMKKPCWAPT